MLARGSPPPGDSVRCNPQAREAEASHRERVRPRPPSARLSMSPHVLCCRYDALRSVRQTVCNNLRTSPRAISARFRYMLRYRISNESFIGARRRAAAGRRARALATL